MSEQIRPLGLRTAGEAPYPKEGTQLSWLVRHRMEGFFPPWFLPCHSADSSRKTDTRHGPYIFSSEFTLALGGVAPHLHVEPQIQTRRCSWIECNDLPSSYGILFPRAELNR